MKKYIVVPAAAGMVALAGNASAQNFDGILAGLDGATAVTAIVAAAAILALVGFAAWGARKVGKFFG